MAGKKADVFHLRAQRYLRRSAALFAQQDRLHGLGHLHLGGGAVDPRLRVNVNCRREEDSQEAKQNAPPPIDQDPYVLVQSGAGILPRGWLRPASWTSWNGGGMAIPLSWSVI